MRIARTRKKAASLFLLIPLAVIFSPAARAQLQAIDFEVTNGKIEKTAGNRLTVSTGEMRATVKFPTPPNVAVNFTYLGPTKEISRLASGEARSQFGIKLRSQDYCNAVFIMWHFAPEQKIAVSVKRNPGKTTREDCLETGSINNIRPRVFAPVPAVHPNQPHTLTALMNASKLTVIVDGKIVWQRDLGPVVLEFNGPVGLLSNNAHVVFDAVLGK